MIRSLCIAALVLLPWFSAETQAQRRTQPQAPAQGGTGQVSINGEIGGKKYQASGSGTCRHAPDASIRGVSASLWMVEYSSSGDGPLKQVNLTLWRPKDGASDQLSLHIETKSGSHRVETGGPGENQGEGSVAILPNGPAGGRLEIKGKDAGGKSLQLNIDCPTFAGIEAEGG